MPWKFRVPELGYRLALEARDEGEGKEMCHIYPYEYMDAPKFFITIHYEDANELQADREPNHCEDW